MMLPFFIRLKVKNSGSRGVNLYLPMFPVYLLLLPLVLILLPFWLLYSLFASGTERGKMVYYMVPAFFELLCTTKGTEVYVDDRDSVVILKII